MTTEELNIKITAETGDAAQNIQQTADELNKLDTQAQTTGADMSQLVEAISTIAGAASQVSAAISASVSGFAVFNSEVIGASGQINELASAASGSAIALNGINDAAADFSGNMSRLDTATSGTADNMTALQSELSTALSSINSFSQNITSAGTDAEEAAKKIKELSDKVNQIPAGGNVVSLAAGFKTLKGAIATLGIGAFIKSSQDAYNVQMQNELKLTAHMKQRMNATDDEVKAIKELASEQQKLGVIGDEIQLAGAQQLTTYAKQTSTLETLIPAMNNLIAQNAGYEASVGDATSAADMLGRALNGQYTSLKRMGVMFTDAQENILKYGNESQRAAVLADAINSKVGNMNQLLSQTPTGKMKQLQNELGDFQEQLAATWQPLISAVLPIATELLNTLSTPIKNISAGISVIGQALAQLDSPAVRAIALAAAGIAVLNKLSLLVGSTSAGLLLLGVAVAGFIGSMQQEQTDVGTIVADAMNAAESATGQATDAMDGYTDSVSEAQKAVTRLAGFDTLTKLSGSNNGSLVSALLGDSGLDDINAFADAAKSAVGYTTDIKDALSSIDTPNISLDNVMQELGKVTDYVNNDLPKDIGALIVGSDDDRYRVLTKWNDGFVKKLFGDDWSQEWQKVGEDIYNILNGSDSKIYQGWYDLNERVKSLFGEDFTNYFVQFGANIAKIFDLPETQEELADYKNAMQGILEGTATIADMFSGISNMPISAGDAIRGNYFRTAIENSVAQTSANDNELRGEVNENSRYADRYDVVANAVHGGMPQSAAEQAFVAVFNLDGEEFASAAAKLRDAQLAISGGMY